VPFQILREYTSPYWSLESLNLRLISRVSKHRKKVDRPSVEMFVDSKVSITNYGIGWRTVRKMLFARPKEREFEDNVYAT
jgi:hypothetical protein